MYWYKISGGDYPDEYVEIILGHEKKYTKEEFAGLVSNLPAARIDARLYDTARDVAKHLREKMGFLILPIAGQYHFGHFSNGD